MKRHREAQEEIDDVRKRQCNSPIISTSATGGEVPGGDSNVELHVQTTPQSARQPAGELQDHGKLYEMMPSSAMPQQHCQQRAADEYTTCVGEEKTSPVSSKSNKSIGQRSDDITESSFSQGTGHDAAERLVVSIS